MAYDQGGYGPPMGYGNYAPGPWQASPLMAAGGNAVLSGNNNPYAGNATRSQLTAANFGGGQQSMYERAPSRFAGQSTRSSITVANFGGDPSQGFVSRPSNAYAPQYAYTAQQSPSPHQYSHPSSFGNCGGGYPSAQGCTIMSSPSHVPQESCVSPMGSPKLGVSPAVEKMIREIAELRVKNGELEDYVRLLEQRLSRYESV